MLLSWFTAEIRPNSAFGFWMRLLWSTGWRTNAAPSTELQQPTGYLQRSTGGACYTTTSSGSIFFEHLPQTALPKTAEGKDTFLHFVNLSQNQNKTTNKQNTTHTQSLQEMLLR